jgi:hypothetical protein
MFSNTLLRAISRKSWKTTPIVRRKCGTWDAGEHADIAAVDQDLSGGRRLFAEEELQEGRLSRAGGARQKDELAPVDRAGHFGQRVPEPAVLLGDPEELDHVSGVRCQVSG